MQKLMFLSFLEYSIVTNSIKRKKMQDVNVHVWRSAVVAFQAVTWTLETCRVTRCASQTVFSSSPSVSAAPPFIPLLYTPKHLIMAFFIP